MSLPPLARAKNQQGRTYVHPVTGKEYPSVTTITGMKDKSGALVGWATRETTEYVVRNWDELSAQTAKLKRYLIKGARFEQKAPGTSFSPAKAGDLIHDIVEGYINTGTPFFSPHALKICDEAEVTPLQAMEEVLPWFENFLAWEKRWKPEWVLAEASVFCDSVGYAGTLDFLFKIGDRTYLGDLKTGKAAYPDYSLQLHALAHGEEIVTLSGEVTPMPKIDAMCILHVTPKYANWIEVKDDPDTWTAFRGLAAVQRWDIHRAHLQFGTTVTSVAEVPEVSP